MAARNILGAHGRVAGVSSLGMPLHGTYTSGSATGTNRAGDRNTCERETPDLSRPEPATRLLGGL